MHRIKKLIGILFILGIVFFIICDEKGIKIEWDKDHIVLHKTEKKSEYINVEENLENTNSIKNDIFYKNSDLIQINYEFENPRNLRKGDGMDPEYLAKLEEEKRLEEEKLKNQVKPEIVAINDGDTISSVFKGTETQNSTGTTKPEVKQSTGTIKPEVKQNTGTAKPEVKKNTGTTKLEVKQNTGTTKPEEVKTVVYYPVKKYEHDKINLNLSNGVEKPTYKVEKYQRKENLALNLYEGKNPESKILYKNSNRIKLYSGFENPRNMRRGAGIDEEFLAKHEDDKPTVISLDDNDTISSARKNNNGENERNLENTGNAEKDIDIVKMNTGTTLEDDILVGNSTETGTSAKLNEPKKEEITYKVEKYQHTSHLLNIKEAAEIKNIALDNDSEEYITIDRPDLSGSIDVNEGKIPEIVLVKIEKYRPHKYNLSLKKGKIIKHDFIIENTEEIHQTESGLSDPMLESLLENDEIDIDTLESENDEFLQKVFDKTRDRDVMNLIVETYLNEYQFVKAKRFIENLPEMYRDELKPSLNLRVAFNSFSLSSKNINENLNSLLQDYSSKGIILDEDKNRYLGVLALMDRNYDKFFEISAGFKSEKNKGFTSKLQGYKDQISKQMGMPDYYFDTLVSLELFNQGLFQPAKVLALYSLQQNPNYILPYQVLAYANFLTNSRDTSIEYLKKLVDLDPNNAEKYRFLMGVAYYRDEKYEQSVVMLSMIKDDKLRLDAQRYLINDYIKLNQKNKLISSRNKLLGYENLVASDFYTYFYETFFHPYSEGEEFQLYAFDTELANKMLRVCSLTLNDEEKAVCTYGTIGRNIALGQFDGMEDYLLNLVAEYPQGYLYQALGDYYVQHGELDKAKAYLLKAVSFTQKRSELNQIKKLLQETI